MDNTDQEEETLIRLRSFYLKGGRFEREMEREEHFDAICNHHVDKILPKKLKPATGSRKDFS